MKSIEQRILTRLQEEKGQFHDPLHEEAIEMAMQIVREEFEAEWNTKAARNHITERERQRALTRIRGERPSYKTGLWLYLKTRYMKGC